MGISTSLDANGVQTKELKMTEETPVSVTMEKDGEIAVIIVNNPPVNALSWHVRQWLADHFGASLADDNVKAIVLRCARATFIAGADTRDFGTPPRGHDFNAVLNSISAPSKPVGAAINGTALRARPHPAPLHPSP